MLRPWFVRAMEASPLGPIATGGAVTVLLLIANLAAYTGQLIDMLLYLPLAIGTALAASALSAGALRRNLEKLRPVLRCSEAEYADLEASIDSYRPTLLWGTSFAGVAISMTLGLSGGRAEFELVLAPRVVLLIGESLFLWLVVVPLMAILVADAARFRRTGAEWLAPPLFEPRALAPFGRVGLRGALLILGFCGLRILFYSLPVSGPPVLATLSVMALASLLATTALLLPCLGARARVREVKQRELSRVRESLERQSFAPGASLESGVPRSYLDLLEYKERVESVREWPLDAPALLRFLLYLLIPLAGWIGGALVEHLLSTLIDS